MIREDLSRTQKFLIVATILAVAFAIRMYRLGHESFWVDEVHQFRVASQSFMEIIENYKQETPHETHDQAPLSMLVTHFFVSDSNPEFFARIPTVLFGVLGVLAIFCFARQFLPFSTSALGAALLALSPLAVWYSQDARWYSQWGFLTTLSYIALSRAVDKPRSVVGWVAYFMVTLANLYTFVYSVFIIAAQGLSLLWRRFSGRDGWSNILRYILVHTLVFAASIPVILMIVQRAETDQFYSGTARTSSLFELPYTFLTFATGFTLGPSLRELHGQTGVVDLLRGYPVLFLVGFVFVPIAVAGFFRVFREPGLASWLVPWLVLPPLAVFFAALIAPDLTYQVRYVFAALPPFVLMIAVGVSSLKKPIRVPALAGVTALTVYSLANFFWVAKYDRADARTAVEYLRSVDSGPIQLVAVGQIENAMYHYGDLPEILVIRDCGTDKGMDHELNLDQTVWLLSGRDWNHDKDRCLPLLESSHDIIDYQTFTGIELWRLEPREGEP